MKVKLVSICIGITCIVLIFSGCIQEENEKTTAEKTISEIASDFIMFLDENNYQEAYELFNDAMRNALTTDQLANLWESYISTYGSFQSIQHTREDSLNGFDVVYTNVTFDKDYLIVFRIVFNDQKLIAGFWQDKTISQTSYTPPEYVNISQFSEINITIGKDPWQLPATLSVPKGTGPFPAVILIQGSGPNDRDETIGPNKPFKDIAWGLASNGIAVLRYDKRTFVYPDETAAIRNFTIEDEIIEDVSFAVQMMINQSYVPVDDIFLLGHSLGAMMIPRIISIENLSIDGGIMLAAAARPLEDLILNQTEYLLTLDGNINESEQDALDEIEQQVQKIKTLNISDNETVLSIPRPYWEYLDSYDPVNTAKNLDIPLFLLQGKRDYQATYEHDYMRWVDALQNRSNVSFQTYEDLNHLFIPGKGIPTNMEYYQKGHVDSDVVNDISEWIQN